MFSFFIALFGLICIGCKFLNEKESDIKYKEELKLIEDRIRIFNSLTMPDHFIETEIRKKIDSGLCVEEIYNELDDDLIFIFGDDYRKKIILPGSDNMGIYRYHPTSSPTVVPYQNAKDIALELFLSHKGMKIYCVTTSWMPGGYVWNKRLYQRIEHNLRNTVGKDPRCPYINIVEIKKSGASDWNDKCPVFAYEHTLFESTSRRKLW